MTEVRDESQDDARQPIEGEHVSRLRVASDLLVFQFKLVLDGLRDILLSPLSIVAVLLGFIAGGRRPDLYFRRLLRLGLKTDRWINLFGEHDGPNTADEFVEPVRNRFMDVAQSQPWIASAGKSLNRRLDSLNSRSDESTSSGDSSRRD